MTRLTPLGLSTQPSLSVLLPRSAIPSMEKGQLAGAKIVASKKIRFFPENKQAYQEALMLYRRSYNLAVELITSGKDKDENGKFIDIRPQIRKQTEQEQKDKGHISLIGQRQKILNTQKGVK